MFAWFSNQPLPDESHLHIHEAMQEVYARYPQFFGGETPLVDPESKARITEENKLDRSGALQEYGFIDVTAKVYYGKRTFSAKDYTALLNTYSDHRAIPIESRIPFFAEIAAAIDRCGGAFTLSDTMLLCMGRKPQSDSYQSKPKTLS